jgi:ornithine cyclodeaminase/alanine dehydrogenase-like protein (mu-crystallin family)
MDEKSEEVAQVTLPEVLRVSPEPCRYHAEAEVHGALTANPAEYVRFMRQALTAVAAGDARLTLPPKQVFDDPATNGDFRVMPCELNHAGKVTKIVKVIGTNTVQRQVPDQITVGKLLLLHPGENFVSDIFEACLLSSARTGACAALAVAALARTRRELLIVGSGRVGLYAGLYCAAGGGVARIRFCDLLADRARQAAGWLAAALPGFRSEACRVADIDSADVVILATTSRTPVASPPGWGANFVVSLGADTNAQSELDPAWTRFADLYCDTLDSLRFGDLRAWSDEGLVDAAAVPNLLEVLRSPPADSSRPRVFISTGSALFDNLTARYLMERGR